MLWRKGRTRTGMKSLSGKDHRRELKKYGLTAIVLWTILIVGLLVWNFKLERKNTIDQARVEARAIWTHNLSYRKWVTVMGGVYVRADRMSPNPYLKIKDRDKLTTDGMALTMANPAYVTRQVFEIIKKESDQPIINRIVSEKYLNPLNKPDEWEQKGLVAFAAGESEVSELTQLEGRSYLRLFRPMITTEGCLLCHGEQGYQVGDIRGGISVAVPMAHYDKIESAALINMAFVYLFLWGLGVGAIVFYHVKIDNKQLLLLESEEKNRLLSSIVQSSGDAIIAKDLDGVILAWNSGAEQIYGYSAEEAIGQSISLIIPSDHTDEVAGLIAQIKRGEQIENYTTERVCKDGRRITVSLTVSPVRDGEGKLVGISAIAHDVSKQIDAEEVLRFTTERLKQAQRLARLGSWELDLVTNTLFWSEEIYRIFEVDPARFGASYEAFLGLIHPDDRAAVNAAYSDSVRNRTPYAIEHRLLFPDGRIKYVLEQCETIYGVDGTPLRSVGTVQDITERKETEEKIRELNACLERRVAERTTELQASQQALMNIVEDLNEKTAELEQANARLQELDRLKSMFVASMSHELRTPLNSIIGFSSILHDEWVGPLNLEQKKDLDIVHRCGRHLLSLINDVIDVSKIEAGKIESIPEEFDLRGLIDEAISLIKKDLEEKGLELKLNVPPQLIYSDQRRLFQCVLNLLSNAVKFTEKGTVSIEVQLVSSPGQESEDSFVEITVADTGIGIRSEDQPRMFQPFVRLISPTQANIPGTGLGLYLTHKLIHEILHGEIRLISEYGQGSRFTIKIPVRMP